MFAELVSYGLVCKGKLLVHIVKPDLGAYFLGGKLGKYLPAVVYGASSYICNNDPFILSYHKTCSFRDDPAPAVIAAIAVFVMPVHLTKNKYINTYRYIYYCTKTRFCQAFFQKI